MIHRHQRLTILGLLLLAISAVAMFSLHRARPDLDAVMTPISFYTGSSTWLLGVTLATSGLGVMTIAFALFEQGISERATVIIALGGAALVLAAFVTSDLWFPWQRRLTITGWIHAIAAGTAVLTFPIGALLATRSMTGPNTVSRDVRLLDWTIYLFLVLFAAFGLATLIYVATGRSPGFLGLAERLLFSLAVVWLSLAAVTTRRS